MPLSMEISNHLKIFGFENIFNVLRIDLVGQYSSGEKFKPQFRLGVDFGF